MTFQQKLLAKQSKKGFTLVELVVVIAILGVLAAIAIPAVIGIINSANESQAKTDAASLDAACKNLYAGVVAGTINKTNPGKIATANQTNLPDAGATASAKQTGALACTVAMGCEYAGLDSLKAKVGDFVYENGTGTIYSVQEHAVAQGKYTALDVGTSFKDLGYK